jgi:hypothetical protein
MNNIFVVINKDTYTPKAWFYYHIFACEYINSYSDYSKNYFIMNVDKRNYKYLLLILPDPFIYTFSSVKECYKYMSNWINYNEYYIYEINNDGSFSGSTNYDSDENSESAIIFPNNFNDETEKRNKSMAIIQLLNKEEFIYYLYNDSKMLMNFKRSVKEDSDYIDYSIIDNKEFGNDIGYINRHELRVLSCIEFINKYKCNNNY